MKTQPRCRHSWVYVGLYRRCTRCGARQKRGAIVGTR
jgi:hypothetical protein